MKMKQRPRETLRFDVPRTGECGYERRRLFQKFVREALLDKEKFPGFLGATGFGSIFSRHSNIDKKWHVETRRVPRKLVPFLFKTINTVQTDYSDIDAYVFFDPAKMIDAKVNSDLLFDQNTYDHMHTLLIEKMRGGLLDFLDAHMPKLKDKHSLLRNAYASQLVRHIFIIPLNETIIDTKLDSYTYLDPAWTGELVNLHLSQEHGKGIYTLFHARMGKDIARLRTYVLKKLLSMNRDVARTIWADIMRRCENWENRGKENGHITYPKTLDDGVRVYAPHLLTSRVL